MSLEKSLLSHESATHLACMNTGDDLSDFLSSSAVSAPASVRELSAIENDATLADMPDGERILLGCLALFDCMAANHDDQLSVDTALIDQHIAWIDYCLSEQLDCILHHASFQDCESTWRSIKLLSDAADNEPDCEISLLNVKHSDLADDFAERGIVRSRLYEIIYTQAYDMPGAYPYAAMVGLHQYSATQSDLNLLTACAKVAASAHCPYLSSVGSDFFFQEAMQSVSELEVKNHFERPDYCHWHSFRQLDESRYVGLAFPKFLLRPLYGCDAPVRVFDYQEKSTDNNKTYLWGNAAVALAANAIDSFKKHGWLVHIRGPKSGGCIKNLPVPVFHDLEGFVQKPPVQVLIPESQELLFANSGLIPLSYYVGTNYACFFSANSAQRALTYDSADATANSRANVRLPYIFLCSRLAHYLKVLQRENIGACLNAQALSSALNKWLKTLVTEMKDPQANILARYPLRAAKAQVTECVDNPGYFSVDLMVVPHFQVEGMQVKLSLVSRMPKSIGHQ